MSEQKLSFERHGQNMFICKDFLWNAAVYLQSSLQHENNDNAQAKINVQWLVSQMISYKFLDSLISLHSLLYQIYHMNKQLKNDNDTVDVSTDFLLFQKFCNW